MTNKPSRLAFTLPTLSFYVLFWLIITRVIPLDFGTGIALVIFGLLALVNSATFATKK